MTLRDQLKTIVDGYFNRFPHMSVNGLSLKSGVPATTLRRIVNCSIKGDPAPHTALNLVSAVSNEKRLSILIDKYDGPLGETLRQVFSPYVEFDLKHKVSADLNYELQDSIKYCIYKACACRSGVSLMWVGSTFGKLGMDKLNEMENSKLIEQRDERIYAVEKDFSLDIVVAAKHLPTLVKFYKPAQVGLGKNLFYNLSESLNEEGIELIKKAQKEAIQKVIKIMNDTQYNGDQQYFSLFLSDTMEFDSEDLGVCQ